MARRRTNLTSRSRVRRKKLLKLKEKAEEMARVNVPLQVMSKDNEQILDGVEILTHIGPTNLKPGNRLIPYSFDSYQTLYDY